MGFHYAKEKAKFDREWYKLRKLYEQAGMSESAIDEIYTYDWRCFCSQRTYENRTQPLPDLYISDEGQSVRSSLLKKFPALSTTFDEQDFPGQYAWIDTIEDPDLFRKINLLSNADLELLTLLVIHGYSEAEIPSSKTCDIIHRSALFHLLILRRSHIRRRKMCRPKSFLLLSAVWDSFSSLQPHIFPDKVLWTVSNPKLWAMDSMELHAGPQSRKSRKPMPMYRFGRSFGAKGKNSLSNRV